MDDEPMLTITEPKLVKEILLNKNEFATKNEFQLKGLTALMGKGLVSTVGDEWSFHRRIVSPAFHHDRIKVPKSPAPVQIHSHYVITSHDCVCVCWWISWIGTEPFLDTSVVACTRFGFSSIQTTNQMFKSIGLNYLCTQSLLTILVSVDKNSSVNGEIFGNNRWRS